MLLRNLTIIFSEIVLGFQHGLEREGPAGGSRHENAARSGEAHYVGVCVRTSYTRCNRADETDAPSDVLHGSSNWCLFTVDEKERKEAGKKQKNEKKKETK